MMDNWDMESWFAQAGGATDLSTGGVTPALQFSTTFVRDRQYVQTSPRHTYSRDHDDVVRLAESLLVRAEGAHAGLLFPSGMAAIAALMRTIPNHGHIVMQSGIYWGVTEWVRTFCARRDVRLTEIDCADPAALPAVKEMADLVWIETPSNPYLKTVDIFVCAVEAKRLGAQLAVDATAATPILTQPLAFGADYVVHSATKGINGHSDVLAGFLGTAHRDHKRWGDIAADRQMAGAVLSPMSAWLLVRGMRTMPLRVQRMSENALAIACYLSSHPSVDQVMYPGLSDNSGHTLACAQMTGGFGSLLSFTVRGSGADALAVAGRLNLFKRATSLGSVESLVEHRHTIERTVPDTLLRLSIGIESERALIADLDQALAQVPQ